MALRTHLRLSDFGVAGRTDFLICFHFVLSALLDRFESSVKSTQNAPIGAFFICTPDRIRLRLQATAGQARSSTQFSLLPQLNRKSPHRGPFLFSTPDRARTCACAAEAFMRRRNLRIRNTLPLKLYKGSKGVGHQNVTILKEPLILVRGFDKALRMNFISDRSF